MSKSTDRVVANAQAYAMRQALNAVSAGTKLKAIDFWFGDNGYGDDTLGEYVQEYKRNKCLGFVERSADTAARDAIYDALNKLTGVKNKFAVR